MNSCNMYSNANPTPPTCYQGARVNVRAAHTQPQSNPIYTMANTVSTHTAAAHGDCAEFQKTHDAHVVPSVAPVRSQAVRVANQRPIQLQANTHGPQWQYNMQLSPFCQQQISSEHYPSKPEFQQHYPLYSYMPMSVAPAQYIPSQNGSMLIVPDWNHYRQVPQQPVLNTKQIQNQQMDVGPRRNGAVSYDIRQQSPQHRSHQLQKHYPLANRELIQGEFTPNTQSRMVEWPDEPSHKDRELSEYEHRRHHELSNANANSPHRQRLTENRRSNSQETEPRRNVDRRANDRRIRRWYEFDSDSSSSSSASSNRSYRSDYLKRNRYEARTSTKILPQLKAVPIYQWCVSYSGDFNSRNKHDVNLIEFLRQINMRRITERFSEVELLRQICYILHGSARIWYERSGQYIETWREFELALRAKCLANHN